MNAHLEPTSSDLTIADQLDALFEESEKLRAEWQKLYLTPSGKPRKRFTPSQDAALHENNARAQEVTAQILALMKEAKR